MIRRPALAILALSAACGQQTFLAAAFVQTPSLPNPQDPANPIPAFQVLTAYFGTIDTSNPTRISSSSQTPITDATGTVAWHHLSSGAGDQAEDRILSVPASTAAAGTYELSSKDDPRLTFEVGQPYVLVLQEGAGGDAYGARFVPAEPTDIAEIKDSTCTLVTPLGSTASPRCMDTTAASLAATPLTLTRTDTAPAGGSLLPAFVLVGQIDPANPSATPKVTYTTVPSTAKDLLLYVLSDAGYRKPSFLLPTDKAFPQTGYYVVSLLVVKQGTVSGNAFLGSIALAATGAAGIVRVQ